MELNLGATIKRLRTEKGMTQEKLAEFAGVSFQAVSKWETNTTLPDITLLPKLAVFFGVTIDELFSIQTSDELERIDYMLENENLTDDNFNYAKQILDTILHKDENDVGALKRYAKLIIYKTMRDEGVARRMLEKAISLYPMEEELYGMLRQASGGTAEYIRSYNDGFINFTEPYAKKYPSNIKLYGMLIEAMVEMRYFDRAFELIEIMKTSGNSGMADILYGDIELARGNSEAAIMAWCKADKNNSFYIIKRENVLKELVNMKKRLNVLKIRFKPHLHRRICHQLIHWHSYILSLEGIIMP